MSETIESYLKANFSSEGTKVTYRGVLTRYFETINKDPETYFSPRQTDEQYLEDVRTWINDFLVGRPSKTCLSYISGLNSFLRANKVKLDRDDIKAITKRHKGMRANRAVTKDRPPSVDELKQILTHGDILDRAFFLMLTTSGMRLNELCNLPIACVKLDENPVRLDLISRITKNGQRRTSFITPEAKLALQEWMKVRETYIILSHSREKNLPSYQPRKVIPMNDSRVFPFDKKTMWSRWNRMCKKAGLIERDEETKRRVLHPHSLRKYFRTHMGTAIGPDMTEEIDGHEGYLTSEYVRHTDKELATAYRQGCGVLLVFEREIPQDLAPMNKALTEVVKENDELKAKLKKYDEMMETIAIVKAMMNGQLPSTPKPSQA
jgi:integrase